MAKWDGYQRFCSLARGLDVVGERWTLLIVQELSFEPIRYNDLRRRLPGIGSNILADRLRKLESHGLLARVPAEVGQGVRYELTERGRALLPAIVELRKWGVDEQLMLHSGTDPDNDPPAAVTHDLSYGVPADLGLSERYQWTVDGVTTTLEIEGTTLTQRRGPAADPAVTITTSRDWMTRLVAGRTDWPKGRADGEVEVDLDAERGEAAWRRMLVATAQPGADLAAVIADGEPSTDGPGDAR